MNNFLLLFLLSGLLVPAHQLVYLLRHALSFLLSHTLLLLTVQMHSSNLEVSCLLLLIPISWNGLHVEELFPSILFKCELKVHVCGHVHIVIQVIRCVDSSHLHIGAQLNCLQTVGSF